MKNLAFKFPEAGETKTYGYAGELIGYTIEKQYADESTWKLLVDQFRYRYDVDNGWRGEFWGKMMRGACLTYKASANAGLYKEIVKTIKDMLSVREKSGRISSYPAEKEFLGWDMWSRKYVMLGFIYFLDICKSETLKEEVVAAVEGCADYILAHVGEGKEKSIFSTSQIYGGLNSCSILEPFVRLYEITGEKRYLDFSEYVVKQGFCSDMNIIELCLDKKLYPYQFTHKKAYEMISCFEGLLEYYKVTGEKKHLKAVENFVDMVVKTDYTIIGCSGCTSEFFDNSSQTQTEEKEGVMQETCVTVTFMKLAAKLLSLTGKAKYAEIIERSGLNALFGAVNDENQTMKKAQGRKWVGDNLVLVEHEAFPFDSYSPLTKGKRGRIVAGFRELQNGRSYGCCAAIGGAGTAIFGLSAIMRKKDGFIVNLYIDSELKTSFKGDEVKIKTIAEPYGKSGAKIKVSASGERLRLLFRIPSYAEGFEITINGEKPVYKSINGYFIVEREWQNDDVSLVWKAPLKAVYKNGKVAFTKGAIVLARDERFGDVDLPVCKSLKKNFKNGEAVPFKAIKNEVFKSNLALKVKTDKCEITLVDYSSAGKNYDDERCDIAVWQK